MSEKGEEEETRRCVDEKQQHQSDYDMLCNQLLSAMNELETLRRRHKEVLNQCEMAAQEKDYFKKQYRATASKFEESTNEIQVIKTKYEQALSDRNKIRQDYEEIVLLREQEKMESSRFRVVVDKDGNENTTASLSLSLEELQRENEDLRYNVEDIKADHGLLLSKYKQLEEEHKLIKETLDKMNNENNNLIVERNTLKQRCSDAIRGFEKALRERDDAKGELTQTREICESRDRELQHAIKVKMQMSKDIMTLREELNSASNEYKLVMSERDSVHQEIEKLQNDLGQTKDKAKKLGDDKEKVYLEKEGLRHEIIAVLADRDKAKKEIHDLRNRLQVAVKEKESSVKQLEEQRQDYELLKQERNAAKKERSEAIVHRDKILKECFEVKTMFANADVNREDVIEGLKKQFDKLSTELTNAWNVAEVALTRRDWAFSERDKVLRELEELKEKYYLLENEKATSDDKLKELVEQHSKLQQQYKDLMKDSAHRKKYTTRLQRESKANLQSSQDSALDSDAPSYHIESIVLERSSNNVDFGFRIGGGNDNPLKPHDPSIFIVDVINGSMAENKLKVNDCVIHVNNVDMTNIDFQTAQEAISQTNYLNITILRHGKVGVRNPLQLIEIKSTEDKSIGLSIDSGLHIKTIAPGSAAAEEETLSIGDKILSVNGQSIENMTYEDAKKLLKSSNLSLTVLKPSVSTTSSHRSLHHAIDEDKIEISEKPYGETVHHFRSTSAPVYMTANISDHLLTSLNHIRSSSVVRGSNEAEYKKIFQELYLEEQKKHRENENEKSLKAKEDPRNERNRSFMCAINEKEIAVHISNSNQAINEPLQLKRPLSTTFGSRQSFSSNSSTGRFSFDFSRNINRSDPLALSPRTVGQASSASNTSVNSSGRSAHSRKKRTFHTTGRYHSNMYQDISDNIHNQRKPLSEIFPPSETHSSERSYPQHRSTEIRHYGTFPGKPPHGYEVSEKSNLHSSIHTTNPHKYFNYKSCSSHGSLNSSEFSDKAMPVFSNIEPVHEETDESLLEFASPKQISSPRSSIRSSRQQKPTSPTYSNSSKSGRTSRIKRASHSTQEEEPRVAVIEKGQYPLGITIAQGQNNGIFVADVTEESIASRSGLKCGDQLLEYNGINLRMASYDQAALILKQSAVENTVTVMVQYNPDKMSETTNNPSSAHSTPHLSRCMLPSSPHTTPMSTKRTRTAPSTPVSAHTRLNSNTSSSSDHSKLTTTEIRITSIPENDTVESPRLIRIARENVGEPLGIGIIGGNSIGIFISDIQKESLAEKQPGLKCGDKILKYNAKDMESCTLEEATLELGKPTEVSDFHVQYNPPAYLKLQVGNGDSFYVRTLYERPSPPKGELHFKKGDILHVTDTLYKGQLGVWRAYIVDETNGQDHKKTKGKIPSKGKAEQELLLRRSATYADDRLKGRKSLFRRSKKSSSGYTINHSRESSDSKPGDIDMSTSMTSSSSFVFTTDDFTAYQYVTRFDSTYPRPVVILGGLNEPICDKLVMEFPNQFSRCLPEVIEATKEIVESKIKEKVYLDYKISRKGDRFECITLQAIKDVTYGKSKHCLLDINSEAMERINSLKLYPIIIFIKHKSAKHIKDLKEGHYIREKISSKSAKEVYDHYNKFEKEHKHTFSATVGGHSLNNICKDIVDCVKEHQKKILWVNVD